MEKDNKERFSAVYAFLKQWSFKSKMELAYQHSLKIMNPFQLHLTEINPDIIETFVMLSAKGLEYNCRRMTHADFYMATDAIKSFHHPQYDKLPKEERAMWIFLTDVSSQLIHQVMNPYHLINRYMYYFTYNKEINMQDEFENKFGVKYIDVIRPISLLWFALIPESKIVLLPKGYKWMLKKYIKAFELITISRKLYNQQLEQITNNIDDYRYCLRPSFQTPFIYFAGERFLPTPHLLLMSVTSSLMYRLTEGNNDLREKIGKHVLESYLYKIISENDEFDEVLPEQIYGDSQKTLDVLSRIGEDIICFDSKSFSPSIEIKVYSSEALNHIRNILADHVYKTYRQIHDKYGVDYTYLSVPVKDDKSNIYAVIVIAEEPYLIRDEIYTLAAEKLSISLPSNEYDWLRGHIGITELSALERQLFDKKGILDAIKRNSLTSQYSDFWFFEGKEYENDDGYICKMLNDIWNPMVEEALKDNVPLCDMVCE